MTSVLGPDSGSGLNLSDDALLVGRVLDGDARAFTELVVHYQQIVYRWALVLAEDPDDADDLVQETFVIVHRKLAGYAATGPFASWLYSIVRRAAGQRRRLTLRRRTITARETDSGSSIYLTDPGARVDRQRAIALIRQCFAGLPLKQREVFDLVDLQGFSPAEAAELTGAKPATVRANLFKARAAIRSQLLMRHPRNDV